jgi:Bacterial regulatory helix-turn-helix protein, lysR family/LysR substrate binding domain
MQIGERGVELHQVRYFVALCRILNFTRAADACNVTQPALTRAIQRLEDELGGPLFQRERGLTQLTELGRLMRPLLEETIAAAEAAKENATRFKRSELATLRIGLPPDISAGIVTSPLREMLRRIPTLEIELKMAEPDRLAVMLLEGEADAALLDDSITLPERLDVWLLFKEGYQLAFAPGQGLDYMVREIATFKLWSQAIQAMLKDTLNIECNLRSVVDSVWFDDAKSGNFDLAIGAIVSTLIDPSDYFNACTGKMARRIIRFGIIKNSRRSRRRSTARSMPRSARISFARPKPSWNRIRHCCRSPGKRSTTSGTTTSRAITPTNISASTTSSGWTRSGWIKRDTGHSAGQA